MTKRNISPCGYSYRKINIREVRQNFLIVCEGEKTEPKYFEGFPVPKDVVDIRGLGQNPSKLVKSTKKIIEQQEEGYYDQVWCVFDRDDWTTEDFNNAIANSKIQEIKVAYSNEAFELWYVLHFEFLNSGIPRSDYIKKLDNLLGHKYKKNSEDIYDELIDKQSIAMKNAKNLLKQYNPQTPVKDNPSTTVHLLVQELNKFIPESNSESLEIN
ncbi:MAG TPA: abortive phage infection protein [Pseudanabaena sp.]|nr:abortive phage infection protein [Pseudanabaena sp.]